MFIFVAFFALSINYCYRLNSIWCRKQQTRVIPGMSWCVCWNSLDNRASLSAASVSPDVYLWPPFLFPPFSLNRQLLYVCLLIQLTVAAHSHTCRVSEGEDEWMSHASEKWKRCIKCGTILPCSEDLTEASDELEASAWFYGNVWSDRSIFVVYFPKKPG